MQLPAHPFLLWLMFLLYFNAQKIIFSQSEQNFLQAAPVYLQLPAVLFMAPYSFIGLKLITNISIYDNYQQ